MFKKILWIYTFALFILLNSCLNISYASKNASPKIKTSGFGLHAVGLPYVDEVFESGASIVRLILATPAWDILETDQGINFEKFDHIVSALHKKGVDIVVTIMPNSRKWGADHLFNSKNSPGDPTVHVDYPSDMKAYSLAIKSIVERYNCDGIKDMPGLKFPVKYYQIVNEWLTQWEGTKESYLKYLKETVKIIKSISPNAKIILGAFNMSLIWAIKENIEKNHELKLGGIQGKDIPILIDFQTALTRLESAGKTKVLTKINNSIEWSRFILKNAKGLFDIIDLHSYNENHYEMISEIKVLKKHIGHEEIWSMENAGPFYRYTPEKHCHELVKRYLTGFYYGLSKIFWSSYNITHGWSKNFLNLSLLSGSGNKKSAYYAYRFMTLNFSNFSSIEKIELDKDVICYRINRSTGPLHVVWSEKPHSFIKIELELDTKASAIPMATFEFNPPAVFNGVRNKLPIKNKKVILQVTNKPVFIGRKIKFPATE